MAGFVREAWSVLEPNADLAWGWSLDAICMHLEAVTRGDILRLLINVPPGMMKSLLVNVFWPAWEWGPAGKPFLRYLTTSFSQDNVIRDNSKMRRLVESEWYQALWGDVVKMSSEQNAKSKFENTATGGREGRAFISMTGGRGDRVNLDDPHSTTTAESDQQRGETGKVFRESIPDRVNDIKTSAIVVIMQRLHEADVSGIILRLKLPYVHLCLPMEFEVGRRCVTTVNGREFFSDPRTHEGELLFPERFPRAEVEALRTVKGEYAYAGQYQQRPSPREGGMFKRANFEVVDAIPPTTKMVRAWDFAASKKAAGHGDPDWSASVKIAKGSDRIFYILHVDRFRDGPGGVRQKVMNTASQDGSFTSIRIPQDPGSAGKTVAHLLIGDLAGYAVKALPVTGDKRTRAQPLASQSEIGTIKLLRGEWNEAFLSEIELFPSGAHDDQVDAAADAFNEIAGIGAGEGIMEFYRLQAEEAKAVSSLIAGPKPALTATNGGVRMRGPDGISTAFGMTGQQYRPDPDGVFIIDADDVTPLKQAGFTDA